MLAFELLESGKAYEKFSEVVHAQGGDLKQPMPQAKTSRVLKAERDGFIRFTDIEQLGRAAIVLGAGHKKSSDKIDPGAGIEVFVQDGQAVRKGGAGFRYLRR